MTNDNILQEMKTVMQLIDRLEKDEEKNAEHISLLEKRLSQLIDEKYDPFAGSV